MTMAPRKRSPGLRTPATEHTRFKRKSGRNRSARNRTQPDGNQVLLKAALRHAREGQAVFPAWWRRKDGSCACGDTACTRQGKHPLGKLVNDGFLSASKDAGIIRNWWRQYPQAHVGIATGEISDLTILDPDQKNGKDGAGALRKLEQELGRLPKTRTETTPSGGEHLHFKYVKGVGSRNDVLGAGLDVKSDGGYVVCAPSAGYHWRDPKAKVAKLPPKWIAHLQEVWARPDEDKVRRIYTGQPIEGASIPASRLKEKRSSRRSASSQPRTMTTGTRSLAH